MNRALFDKLDTWIKDLRTEADSLLSPVLKYPALLPPAQHSYWKTLANTVQDLVELREFMRARFFPS